jgi:hypothetical protein
MIDKWDSIVHKFSILGADTDGRDLDGYLIVGAEGGRVVYLDLFLGRAGDTLAAHNVVMGLATDALAAGVPIEVIAHRLAHQRYLPAGQVRGAEGIHTCDSISDYVGKLLLQQLGE